MTGQTALPDRDNHMVPREMELRTSDTSCHRERFSWRHQEISARHCSPHPPHFSSPEPRTIKPEELHPNPKGPPDPSTPPASTALPRSGASTQRHSPFLLSDSHSALGNKDSPWKEVNYKWNEKVPPSVSVAFSLVHRAAHHHKRLNKNTRTPTLSDPTPFMCSSIISLL